MASRIKTFSYQAQMCLKNGAGEETTVLGPIVWGLAPSIARPNRDPFILVSVD